MERSRWRTVLGVLLVLAGLGMLGYVGWQMFGTNVIAGRTHRELTDQVEQRWRSGQEFATYDAGSGERARVSALIRIPRFGDDYVVPVLEGTSDAVLAAGFGHFPDTADVGGVGNYALAAHRVTHGEPLRDMPELQPGDRVVVETRRLTYVYALDTGGDDLVVPFTDTWVIQPHPVNPEGGVQPPRGEKRLITLTTCSEFFHTDDRMVAFGHLVDKRRTGG